MLSDHERRTLREVENQLTAQDPEFTRSFVAAGQPSTYSVQWLYELPWWVYRVGIGLAVAFGFLMVLAGSPWTAVVFAGLALLCLKLQNGHSEPGRRER